SNDTLESILQIEALERRLSLQFPPHGGLSSFEVIFDELLARPANKAFVISLQSTIQLEPFDQCLAIDRIAKSFHQLSSIQPVTMLISMTDSSYSSNLNLYTSRLYRMYSTALDFLKISSVLS